MTTQQYFFMAILKSILLLSILISSVTPLLIFANFVTILNQREMIFSTRYKYTDLLITNKTKEMIASNGEIKQLEQVPQVGVRFGGSTSNWVYELGHGVYVYAAFQGIQLEQVDQYLDRIIGNSTNQIVLMSHQYKKEAIPGNYRDKVCFYDDIQRAKQQIKQVLKQCLQQYLQQKHQNYLKQESTIQSPNYYIVLLSLILCCAFTGSKLFLIHLKSSQNSGV